MKYQLKLNKGSLNKVKTNKGKTNKGKTNKARLNKVKINKGRFRNNLKKTYKNIKKGGYYHQQGYYCDWCGGATSWQGDHVQYHYCCEACEQAHWAWQWQQQQQQQQ